MALSAGLPADFNEDDFEEYNPHPYLGGYDLALTYGQPLPPSSATCYPISSSSSSPPPHKPPTPPPPPSHYALPENYQPEPFPSPDLFRSWPFSDWDDHQAYGHVDAGGGWNGWRRALDYLFGHAVGYGERRVGVDGYGIPIYANKKLGSAESISVEVEPAPVQRLEYHNHRPDSWPSCYSGGTTEERHGYENPVLAYNRHYSEEALRVEIDPNGSVWHQKLSYHEGYEDREHHDSAFDESDCVTTFFGGPGIAYNRHHYEQPLHVQVEPIETTWSQKSSCSELYRESTFPKSDWSSSYYDNREDESNFIGSSGLAYERYSHEPPDRVELEPFKPTWSQNLDYYEEEESPKLNWISSYDEVSQEQLSPTSRLHYSLFGDRGDKTTISEEPNHSIQREYYEQALSVQLDPYKSTWSQYPSYYEAHNEQVSEIYDCGSDSLFDPFQNYLEQYNT